MKFCNHFNVPLYCRNTHNASEEVMLAPSKTKDIPYDNVTVIMHNLPILTFADNKLTCKQNVYTTGEDGIVQLRPAPFVTARKIDGPNKQTGPLADTTIVHNMLPFALVVNDGGDKCWLESGKAVTAYSDYVSIVSSCQTTIEPFAHFGPTYVSFY